MDTAIHGLRQQLDSLEVTTPTPNQFTRYLTLAARLAAFGDDSYLRSWPERAKQIGLDIERFLEEHADQGITELEQSTGQTLAVAIIKAQDFACFFAREREILPQTVHPSIDAWMESAEKAALDETAAEHLRDFLREFPLPEEERLPVVDTPITEFEWTLASAVASTPESIELRWPAYQAEPSEYEPVSYDAIHPSERIKRRFERIEVPFDLSDGIRLLLTRQLDDAWRVVLNVDFPEGRSKPVQLIRLGMLPGIPTDDGDAWIIDLRPLEHMERVRILDETLGISFFGGPRVFVTQSS